MPPGVASACFCVAVSRSARVALGHGGSRGTVRAAPDRHLEAVLAGEGDRDADVGGLDRPDDDRRASVDPAVPQRACLVVPGVLPDEDLADDGRPQGLDVSDHHL
jgi:hypothetical protein